MPDVKLPERILWPSGARQLGGWANYLPLGFQEFGIPFKIESQFNPGESAYHKDFEHASADALELNDFTEFLF